MAPPHQHYGIMALYQSSSSFYLSPATWCHVLRLVALVGALWNLGFDGHEGVCASASQDCLGNVYFLDTIYVVIGVGW